MISKSFKFKAVLRGIINKGKHSMISSDLLFSSNSNEPNIAKNL